MHIQKEYTNNIFTNIYIIYNYVYINIYTFSHACPYIQIDILHKNVCIYMCRFFIHILSHIIIYRIIYSLKKNIQIKFTLPFLVPEALLRFNYSDHTDPFLDVISDPRNNPSDLNTRPAQDVFPYTPYHSPLQSHKLDAHEVISYDLAILNSKLPAYG